MDYPIRAILFATDLSGHAPEVARHAIGIAHRFGAKLHVLHALEPLSDYAYSLLDTYLPPETLEALRQQGGLDAARQSMQQRLEQFCREQGAPEGTVATIKVVEALPAMAILDEAKSIGADLIVMGSHGQSALSEIFMGSVAHKVIMNSKLPVLLVPIKEQ
jgi:nucleotide-binding universal stress UspA family protein